MEKKEKKTLNFSSRQRHVVIATAIVFFAIIAMSVAFILRIYFMTEAECYADLAAETEDAITVLEGNLRSDRMTLRIMAGMIAGEEDLDSIRVSGFLSNYELNSLISQIGILTPDNTFIRVSGHKGSTNGLLDFDEEYARGEHISGLQPSMVNTNVQVIRNYVPIRREGRTIAMLYSAGNPSNMAQAWLPKIYNGDSSVYVVERRSGDILIDTSTDPIANINDIDFIETSAKYSREATIEDILGGKSGYSVYRSEKGGEILYMCYLPFGIEDWEMVVFVPESAVFSSVHPIRVGMFILLAVMLLILAGYAVWLFTQLRRSLAETERKANIDVLTGLQNRNRYEAYLKKLDVNKKDLTCLYIDANGLHELNNSKGHLAGDQMLRFIADALKLQFGEETVYRIGGDEFVVFQSGRSEAEMQKCMKEFNEQLRRNDYHAAIGLCVYGFGMSVDQMIKNAEKEMYAAKKKYYESIGKVMRV